MNQGYQPNALRKNKYMDIIPGVQNRLKVVLVFLWAIPGKDQQQILKNGRGDQ